MSLIEVKTAESSFKDSILQLQDIFTYFDKLGNDGLNGCINCEKLHEALYDTLGISFGPQELYDMISAIDLNNSGDIQFNEFLKMMDQAKLDAELMNGGGIGGGIDEGDEGENEVNDDGEQKEDGVSSSSSSAANAASAAKRKAALAESALLQAESEFVMTREDIKAIFQQFDTDHDGRVSAAELQAMLKAQGEKYSEEEVHAMIHLVDGSNSGMISYQAFVRLMMSAEE